jgi:MoaA/NifB/PqqE/SkfB family radical SAM enzyme
MRHGPSFIPIDDIGTTDPASASSRVAEVAPRSPSAPANTDEPKLGISSAPASPRLTSVSVIIPYTKPETVGNAIESVLLQDYPEDHIEIIVVGKGSQALRGRFPRITAVEAAYTVPPGKARNLGAARATGSVLLFLDDDCEAQPGWIAENLAELELDAVGAVSGRILGKSQALFARCTDYSNFGSCRGDRRKPGRLWTASFGMRSDLFKAIGGFDESLAVQEDIDLCFRLNRHGYETIHQPRIAVLHNHGRHSLRSFLSYQYQNGRRAGLGVESRYPEAGLRNMLLSMLAHPLLYLPAVLPFALLGTVLTVWENFRQDQRVALVAPAIFVGKLTCHLGILRALLDRRLRGYWVSSGKVRAVRTLFDYMFLKARFTTPRVLTLYVTSACNAKCKHCFYWQNLNQKADLRMEEIDELSRSLGKLDKLLIAGGEPFLRRELPEICGLFIRQNDVEIISIPTNGLLPDLIARQLRKTLALADGRSIRVNFSLDGTQPVHDDIRGVPGNFQKVVETFNQARQLQAEYPNLTIGINSCVMNANYRDLFGFYDEFPALFPDVDMPGLILLRGDPYEPKLELPTIQELEALHSHKRARAGASQPLLWKLADMANFRIGLESIRTQSQAVPCEAGRILGVVEDNGNVRHCELLPPIGNLREKGFREIWDSPEAVAARERIVRGECHCTHECNVFESLLAHPAHGLKALAKASNRKAAG